MPWMHWAEGEEILISIRGFFAPGVRPIFEWFARTSALQHCGIDFGLFRDLPLQGDS